MSTTLDEDRSFRTARDTSTLRHLAGMENDGENAVEKVSKRAVSLERPCLSFHGEKPWWGWEYLFVFNDSFEDDEERMKIESARERILGRLHQGGFQYSAIRSPDGSKIFLRIGLLEEVLKLKAEEIGYKLETQPALGGGYLEFRRDQERDYINYDRTVGANPLPYFTAAERVKILLEVLASTQKFGCGITLRDEIYEKHVIDAFALHFREEQLEATQEIVLKNLWKPFAPMNYKKIREYTGERVAIYFAFIDYFSKLQWILSIIAVPVYVLYLLRISPDLTAALQIFYGVCLSLWTTFFIICWTMRQALIRLQWGNEMDSSPDEDKIRPELLGKIGYGFYTPEGFVKLQYLIDKAPTEEEKEKLQRELPMYPVKTRRSTRRIAMMSIPITGFFCMGVGGIVFCLLWFKEDIIQAFADKSTLAKFIPGVLNSLVMMLCEPLWKILSERLTFKENHQTRQQHINALVIKRFTFLFFGYFMPLFYIAFAKSRNGRQQCEENWWHEVDCMGELEFQLLSMLITRLTVSQFIEFALPWILSKVKQLIGKVSGGADSKSRYAKEYSLPSYDSTIEDYLEVLLLFGFVALFGLAFPVAATIVALNNTIELRADAYRIIMFHRRINAEDASSIGVWYHIINLVGFVSVLTNGALICFTSNAITTLFGSDDTQSNLLIQTVSFFLFENILFGIKGFFDYFVPNIPWAVFREKARSEFLIWRYFGVGFKRTYVHRPFDADDVVDKKNISTLQIDVESDVDDSDSHSSLEENLEA